ncbi:MAG: NADH-quinone oxidoreductase subunit G [Gammaproteobacteria bacterium]|nr:NADH-quinone oxidoreductase subunit G [Gammaproteobacteria bacterium]MDE2345820.1 NADH-quinone oxidoreductase subunit G [Gammaproteobacteria bacterium]
MSEQVINIEIDGQPIKARKGEMIMQAADREGIYIPRFCYHDKLSVAANCRMCLIEAEKSPKPLPACATPVTEGMKIYTRSVKALAAQRASMEFLLINHPLDCPICDQGGECELQDLAMGYGRDIARFAEKKRVIKDENIGPLISTFMTRCIYCTRCVRFGQEIAGIQELGDTGRGERSRIGTYIGRSVDHELSGNVIDLCPVGALNSKPFKMHGRGWEMTQTESISPHDCIGSNLYGHVLRGELMRVVPKANQDVNENWISDRDRFSYTGIASNERLLNPMIKKDGAWLTADWETALTAAAGALREAHGDAGVLASPSSTVEELYLLQKLARSLGIHSIDTRLRQADFRDDEFEPVYPWLGVSLAEIEAQDSVLVIGSNARKEVPLLAHRLRKAALRGAAVMFLNPRHYEFLHPVAAEITAASGDLPDTLAAILKAALGRKSAPTHLKDVLKSQEVDDQHRKVAEHLLKGERKSILLGHLAQQHPRYADLRSLAAALADITGARLGYVPQGANTPGAWLAGAVPHRLPGGRKAPLKGLDANGMFAEARRKYLLMGIEPEFDCWNSSAAMHALHDAEAVVMITPFVSERMKQYATVLLPGATFAETSGSYVNAEGRWQSFSGMTQPLGESRPGWKILRVLGNFCGAAGFDYSSSEEVLKEVKAATEGVNPDTVFKGSRIVTAGEKPKGYQRIAEVPLYSTDMLVRRAAPLQQTRDADNRWLRLSPADAKKLGVAEGEQLSADDGLASVELPVLVDASVAPGDVFLAAGIPETAAFGAFHMQLQLAKPE